MKLYKKQLLNILNKVCIFKLIWKQRWLPFDEFDEAWLEAKT